MSFWLWHIVFLLGRWLHIVFMTLIVGGTLFFELVLPIAIENLKREDKLYIMARARLVFRWVVWISVIGLLLTGALSAWRMWHTYQASEFVVVMRWAIAHIVVGLITMVIALLLTIGRRPPEDPVRWMRLNLVILLVAIFLGSATHHYRITLREEVRDREGKVPISEPQVDGDAIPATQP
jgi:uncharacterized membrane protein